jgi:hypothetical protein
VATDAREEEGALDLGVKLMSKFARSSRGHRRTTRQVFAVWKRYHETIKKNTMYAMNIANLMRRALQRRNFFRWRERLLRAREENRKVQRARRITARNKRVRAFARWRDAHREGRGVRVKVRRGLQRIARRVLAGAFYDWAELLEDRRRRVDEAAEKVRQDEARAERAERLARSYDNKLRRLDRVKGERLARLALARWRRRASEAGAARRLLARAVARFARRDLARAHAAWRARAAEDRRKRVAVRRAVNRMTRRALAGAFDAWRVVPRDARRRDVRAATARRVLVAASSRLAFRAFSRWRGLAAEIREAEVKTRRAAQRMLRRHFARAFYQWADTAAVLGRERAERERALRASDARAKLCERFFLAARRRELSAAFAGFRDIARRLARTRRVVGKSPASVAREDAREGVRRVGG